MFVAVSVLQFWLQVVVPCTLAFVAIMDALAEEAARALAEETLAASAGGSNASEGMSGRGPRGEDRTPSLAAVAGGTGGGAQNVAASGTGGVGSIPSPLP